MPASIRGHQGQIKFFKNGEVLDIVSITSAEVNQDSDFSRSQYVGNPYPEGDQAIMGWSGSVEMEVKDAKVDEFIDGLVNNNLVGVGADEYTMVLDEYYPDGQIASYVYWDMQFRMSKRMGGLSEKQTKRLDFQASGRTRL